MKLGEWAFSCPNLSAEDEYLCWNDESKWGLIVQAHMKLVYSEVAAFTPNPQIKEDMVSEGILGLYDCLKASKPSGTARFATLARLYVRGKLLLFIKRSGVVVKMPTGDSEKSKAYWVVKRLVSDHQSEHDLSHIQDVSGLSREVVQEALECLGGFTSIEEMHNVADDIENPEVMLGRSQQIEAMHKNLIRLEDDGFGRMAQVLRLRFLEERSIAFTAVELGISHPRVTQLMQSGLKKVSKYHEET